MGTVNFGQSVSLAEFASLLTAIGDTNIIFGMGEPGIGKSSIMDYLERHFGDAYNYVYFDCANKDLGDVVMPSVDKVNKITEYFPNAVFKLQEGKPMIIMLDEFTKAPQPIQNMLHPMLEVRNKRLGDTPLPKGSIVFLTGNMASDGVGDQIKGHSLNRMTRVVVRKPNHEEWLAWAIESDKIDPVVMAWVNQHPHAMESYLEGNQDSNPYIFNPKKMNGACVSPRSLELVSNVVANRHRYTENALLAAMAGTIGESAARDMHAFIDYQDKLPLWQEVIDNPTKAKVPDSPGACAVMVFGAVSKVTADTIDQFMTYLERLDEEWQAAFSIAIAKNATKQQIAFKSKKFHEKIRDISDLL